MAIKKVIPGMVLLDLTIPSHAREYIRTFKLPGEYHEIGWVQLNSGRRIFFNQMNDGEAVLAASALNDILMHRLKGVPRD